MSLPTLEPLDVRIPDWSLNDLIKRKCPFCKINNRSVLIRPDRLTVAFCEECGCYYIDCRPKSSELAQFYDSYYQNHRPKNLQEKNYQSIIRDACKKGKYNWQLQTLFKLYAGNKNMRILDVGCGFGDFLLQAKLCGASVVGCDISPEACDFVNNKLGINAYQSELRLCSSAIGKGDAVVMKDFIEHSVEPLTDIIEAVKILQPGGLLLLQTPNGGEAGTDAETAKTWVGFRVDLEHLQYFSPLTINWLSQKLKLSIEQLETSGFPYLKNIDKAPYLTNLSSRQNYNYAGSATSSFSIIKR